MLIQFSDYHAAWIKFPEGGLGLLLIFQVLGFNHAIIIPPVATGVRDEEMDYVGAGSHVGWGNVADAL